jgi:pimeloyl-ACP methyl ester carboxylesterase
MESFSTFSAGIEIKGIIHWPERETAPCVICSHGLFSSKDSPKFVAVTESLARNGIAAIRYDHCGCGESGGRIEDTTVSSRLNDLESVHQFVLGHPRMNGHIGYMGSSMGGYISLFACARHPEVGAVVVWATPFSIRWKRADSVEAGQPLLSELFFEDLQEYALAEVLGNVKRCLVVHGREDELVPVRHAHRILELLDEPKAIEIFPEADHRFTREDDRQRAIALTTEWLKIHLG